MIQRSVQNTAELATALLDIVPDLLRRLGADVPLDEQQATNAGPGWREVVELRATPGQLTLLSVLMKHECCTMQELAEHLAVAPSTATAMVKRLLAQGYIERRRDEKDWRTVWVAPTEAGRLAVNVFHQARLHSLQCRLKQLNDDERNAISAALPALQHLVEV
jgi:MarR family transcriptional regulator, organic hydroperoxide resistance regulator